MGTKKLIIGWNDKKCDVCHQCLAYVAYGNPTDPKETQLENSVSFCFYCERDPDKIVAAAKRILVDAEKQELLDYVMKL